MRESFSMVVEYHAKIQHPISVTKSLRKKTVIQPWTKIRVTVGEYGVRIDYYLAMSCILIHFYHLKGVDTLDSNTRSSLNRPAGNHKNPIHEKHRKTSTDDGIALASLKKYSDK